MATYRITPERAKKVKEECNITWDFKVDLLVQTTMCSTHQKITAFRFPNWIVYHNCFDTWAECMRWCLAMACFPKKKTILAKEHF